MPRKTKFTEIHSGRRVRPVDQIRVARTLYEQALAAKSSPKVMALRLNELGEVLAIQPLRPLTLKQRAFGLAFVGEANGNGTEAARLAKYKGDDPTLSQVAYENLRKPEVAEFIKELRREAEQNASDKILNATEVLVGLTKIATSDIAEVINDPFLIAAQEKGVSKLIKTINFDKDTGKVTRIEMYNAQTAFVDLGKHLGLFPTKIEISKSDAVDAIKQSGAPLPETFHGEPVVESEM